MRSAFTNSNFLASLLLVKNLVKVHSVQIRDGPVLTNQVMSVIEELECIYETSLDTPAASRIVIPISSSTATSSIKLLQCAPSNASDGNKRGLAYNDASVLSNFVSNSSKVSWAYNWAETTSELPSGLEYVPMLWGLSSHLTSTWPAAASSAVAAGASYLLSFNEPDEATQSNISYTDAAEGYLEYMQPFSSKAKLGAPAVTNGEYPMGLMWLENFLHSCSNCTIDFIPIHWYADADEVDYFKSYLQETYAVGGSRPIWITEFGAAGSVDQQNTFLQTVLPWLDAQDYVQRYAYFMAADGSLLSTGDVLSTLGDTFAFA